MFAEPTEVSDLQPFVADAIELIKEEIHEEIPNANREKAECSYKDSSTAIKTETLEEYTGNEQDTEDHCCIAKNVKIEPLEVHEITYQLVRFWPAGNNIIGSSEQNQRTQELTSSRSDNFSTKHGIEVSDIRLWDEGHYNQTPVNTEIKCSITETDVLWTETQNKYSIQETKLSCGRSLDQSGSDTVDISNNYYVCDVCSEVFLQETELNVHKLRHSAFQTSDCNTELSHPNEVCKHKSIDKLYQCDICDKTFSHEHYFEQHRATHSSNGKYRCARCNITFITFNELKDHKYQYCKSKKYQCKVCNKLFETSYAVETHCKLNAHEVVHNEVRELKCDLCNKTCKTPENLSQHKLVHKRETSSIPNHTLQRISHCRDDDINKSLTDVNDSGQRTLRNQVVHINIRKHKCDLCDKAFVRAYDLMRHRLLPHGSKKNNSSVSFDNDRSKTTAGTSNQEAGKYKCNQCNKTFSRGHILSQHMSSFHVHNSDPRKHKCNLCDKSYINADSLTQHQLLFHRNNSDIKKYKCKFCDKTSTRRDCINRHELVIHGNNSKCVKTVTTSASISKRKFALHGINRSGKKYKCNLCDKVFLWGKNLRQHELSVHKSEKNNKQKVLNDASEMSDNLSEHASLNPKRHNDLNEGKLEADGSPPECKTHDNVMKYECSVCNRTFKSYRGLWQHKSVLHSSNSRIKKYKCHICNIAFKFPYSLQQHLYVHKKKKPGSIKMSKHILFHNHDNKKECTSSNDSSEFKVHDQVLKAESGMRKYKCDLCEITFARMSNMTQHKLKFHRKEETDKKEVIKSTSEVSDNLPQHISLHKKTCDICCRVFNRPSHMIRHKLSVHKNEKKEFTGSNLVVYNEVKHGCNKTYKCSVCGKAFGWRSSLSRHKLSVHKNKKTETNKVSQYISHTSGGNNKACIVTDMSPEPILYNQVIPGDSVGGNCKCNLCGKALSRPSSLSRHKLSVHKNEKTETNKVSRYISHTSGGNNKACIVTDMSPEPILYNQVIPGDSVGGNCKCNLCGKVLSRPSSLSRHKLSVHKNKKTETNKVSQYISHTSGGNNKACIVTDMSPEPILYNQVIPGDSVDGNCKCNLCGKALSRPSSLRRHKLCVHKYKTNDDINKVVPGHNTHRRCNLCGKAFRWPSDLKRHKLHVHKYKTNDDINKVVPGHNIHKKRSCNLCGKAFRWPSDLKRHKLSGHRKKKHKPNKVSQHFSHHNDADNNKAHIVTDALPQLKLCNEVVQVDNIDRQYKCNVCEKTFKKSVSLSVHTFAVHGINNDIRKYKCRICNKMFLWNSNLRRHVLTVHKNEKNVKRKVFTGISETVDGGVKKYKCNLCCKTFVLGYNLLQHKLITHGITKSIKKHKCNVCSKTFSKSAYMSIHKCAVHGVSNGIRKYKCNLCDKVFLWDSNLRRHKLTVHKNEMNGKQKVLNCPSETSDNGIRKYKCDLCEKAFTRASHVTRHKLSVHKNKNECYKIPNSVSQHMPFQHVDKTETSIDPINSVGVDVSEKNVEFRCDICGKNFKKPHNLKQHKVVHLSVKYNCNVCNVSFSEPDLLLQHIALHSDGDNNHQCNVCNKVYTSDKNLKRHKVLHKKAKSFKCDMCDKSFTKSFNLLEHKLTEHNVVREYNCDVCDRGFVTAELLSQHVSLHSDDNCYHCDICNMVYTKREHLVQHRLIHNHQLEK